MYNPNRLTIANRPRPQSDPEQRLSPPLTREAYFAAPMQHLHFQHIEDYFECSNEACMSKDVVCIWYQMKGIDFGVDETFGELYCNHCHTYTYIDFFRDSS